MITVLRRSLVWGGIVALVLLIAAGTIGWFVAGAPGVLGAVLAVVIAVVFLGITSASILVGARIAKRGGGDTTILFAIVGGIWLLKFVLFIVLMILLMGATWLSPLVFGPTLIVAVVAQLVVDVIAMLRTRVPIIDEP